MLRKIEEPQLLDVLERILDKGIVIDAWIRFSLAGIDFLTVEARIVVASIETYLQYAQRSQFHEHLCGEPSNWSAQKTTPRIKTGSGSI